MQTWDDTFSEGRAIPPEMFEDPWTAPIARINARYSAFARDNRVWSGSGRDGHRDGRSKTKLRNRNKGRGPVGERAGNGLGEFGTVGGNEYLGFLLHLHGEGGLLPGSFRVFDLRNFFAHRARMLAVKGLFHGLRQ